MKIKRHKLIPASGYSPPLTKYILLMCVLTASASAAVVATSVQIPYRDTVFANNEFVRLAGSLHVLTQVTAPTDPCSPGDPCRSVPVTVHFNLDGVTASTTSSSLQA